MKFTPALIDQIIKELEKVPNIRYVCQKVGIDHSTFYRWLVRHPTFNKRVVTALYLGKRAISGSAEAVIINGVTKGDFKSSTFWLTHNDQNYMQKEKASHHHSLLERDAAILEKPIKYDGSNFETVFKFLDEVSKEYGERQVTQGLGRFMVEFFCENDETLISICYAAYEQWRDVELSEETDVTAIHKEMDRQIKKGPKTGFQTEMSE